jgi:hypothetical protein
LCDAVAAPPRVGACTSSAGTLSDQHAVAGGAGCASANALPCLRLRGQSFRRARRAAPVSGSAAPPWGRRCFCGGIRCWRRGGRRCSWSASGARPAPRQPRRGVPHAVRSRGELADRSSLLFLNVVKRPRRRACACCPPPACARGLGCSRHRSPPIMTAYFLCSVVGGGCGGVWTRLRLGHLHSAAEFTARRNMQ